MIEQVQSPEKVVEPLTRAPSLLVLGMHRSGTSVITRAVNLLGVDLGPEQHMHGTRIDNPTGFWENGRLVALNDELLSRHGGTWDEPPILPPYWQFAPGLEDCRRRARELIRAEFGDATNWGWKDPRTCLTLPFWQQLLAPMSYIICLRNPLDVARSLQARDNFAPAKSFNLWLIYMEAALVHTAGQRRLFLFYEDFMADRRRELHRLAAFLGSTAIAKQDEAHRALDDFIKRDLQHHQSSLLDAMNQSELAFPAQALQVVLRLYTNLTRPADARAGEGDQVLQRAIDQLSIRAANAQRESLSQRIQLGNLSAHLTEQQQKAQDLAVRVTGQEGSIQAAAAERGRLSKQLAEQEDSIQAAAAEREQLSKQLAEQEGSIQAAAAERERLSKQLAEQDQQVLRLAAQRDQLLEDVSQLRAGMQLQQRTLQEHVQQAQRLAAHITEREHAIQAMLVEKQRLSNQNAEHERHLAHLRAERSQLLADSARLTASLQQTDAELKRSQVELELARAELQWMQSTRFWRFRDRVLSFKRWLRQSKRFLISVESPASQEAVGTKFDLSGWCVSTGKLRIKSMRAKVGDKAFEGVYGLARPDVARAHIGVAPVGAAEKSGFQIPMELAPGQYEIQLKALDAGDQEHAVSSYAVRIG